MEPVGQARRARVAARLSTSVAGWWRTKEKSSASPKVAGASCRQVSQLMQVSSTKKSPETFRGSRLRGLAIIRVSLRLQELMPAACIEKMLAKSLEPFQIGDRLQG